MIVLHKYLDVICTLTNATWKQDAETKIIEIEGQGCGINVQPQSCYKKIGYPNCELE
jgi:hypothetical protein